MAKVAVDVPWSAEEVARLRELISQGETSKKIAASLGRTFGSVSGKRTQLRKAGGTSAGSTWTKADKFKVISQLHYRSLEAIAEGVGRTPHAVRTMLHREGIKCASGRYSLRQLSRMTGLSRHTLLKARGALKGRWNTGSGKSGRMVSDSDIVQICEWVLEHSLQVSVPVRRLRELIQEFQEEEHGEDI